MKIVRIDPVEHRSPSGEEFTTYARASKDEYKNIDEFFYATVETGFFPKDERWYKKKELTDEKEIEDLKTLFETSSESSTLLPDGPKLKISLHRDWDEADFLFESDEHYGRFYWYTTA